MDIARHRRLLIANATGIITMAASFTCHSASLTIVIEQLDQDAAQCGITEPQLETRVRFALRDNRVEPERNTPAILYLAVTTMVTRGGVNCIGNVKVQISVPGSPLANSGFRSRYAVLMLCDQGSLIAYAKSTFSKQIGDTVEILVKQCLGSLDY